MKKRLVTAITVFAAVLLCLQATAATTTVNVGSLLDASKWEMSGDKVSISSSGIVFDTAAKGVYTAILSKDTATDVTYKLNVKLSDIPQGLKSDGDPWDWWDAELLIMARGKVAGTSSTDGQAGYCLTSWGDMKTVYIGKSGSDDYFTPDGVEWDLWDGEAHDIEFTTENISGGKVKITLKVDGKQIFSGEDTGEVKNENKKEKHERIHTEAGGLVIRAKYVGVTVKGVEEPEPTTPGDTSEPSSPATSATSAASVTAAIGVSAIAALAFVLLRKQRC